MAGLLEGLTVVVVGDARRLRVAARWFEDLGATVRTTPRAASDAADDLWLGRFDPLDALDPPRSVDLALVDEAPELPRGLPARTTVLAPATSSRASRPGQRMDEPTIAAAGGVAVAIGEPDRPPLPLPEGCLDALVGTHIAAAGLAALLNETPETEVAAVDVAAWAVGTNMHLYLPYGLPWLRAGRRASGSGGCYPYGLFDASDGLYCLIGRTDHDWRSLIEAMGDPPWARDVAFGDPRTLGRRHPERADAHVGPWTARHTRAELTDIMARYAFPGGPVLRPDEVLQLPSIAGRWRTVRQAGGPEVRTPGRPFDVLTVAGAPPGSPLRGLFVLDLSWVWSGPAVGVGLADLGATVVKIESATRPDNTRLRGAPEIAPPSPGAPPLEVTAYFHAVNRGKRSVALDLTTEGGRSILWRLASKADVIVENLTPGVMARFGIAPDRVLESNPGCVFLSMPGYREHPTTKGLRAYAPVLSSGAGIEALVAYPGEEPVGAMTFGYSDANAASQGLLLALAGLYTRRSRSAGAAVTLCQFDAAVFSNGHNIVAGQLGERATGLEPIVDDEFVTRAEDLPDSPWVSPDLFARVSPRWVDELTISRLPWRMNGHLPPVSHAGPELGQHTDEELAGRLGLGGTEIAALRESGALT